MYLTHNSLTVHPTFHAQIHLSASHISCTNPSHTQFINSASLTHVPHIVRPAGTSGKAGRAVVTKTSFPSTTQHRAIIVGPPHNHPMAHQTAEVGLGLPLFIVIDDAACWGSYVCPYLTSPCRFSTTILDNSPPPDNEALRKTTLEDLTNPSST
ncbi:hypothetical protein DER44DRAFT_192516 [Fusarium oxysporum]|nr:hypothetical protein DER44DRAFT_192516 [Fusarium oxysporum]